MMRETDQKLDIILIHIDDWFPMNNALAILDPVLKQAGFTSQIVNSSHISQYLDQADVFGISVMDHTYRIARTLTKCLQDKTVIWGGWTATALPEYILTENPGVDYVVLQEGERRLVTLLRSLKQPELFDALDGIAYRDGQNTICIRPPEGFVDMNDLPLPNEMAIQDDLVFVELARGCYGRCGYCQENSKMRFKSALKTADEIHSWHQKGFKKFYLGNANSLANGQLLRALMDELESRNLPIEFCLVGRPEDVLRNYDMLERIFKNPTQRLITIEVGVEANTQRLLDLLGRKGSPATNHQAISALRELQQKYSPTTRILANMILFSHYDMTMEELIANIRFIGEYGCTKDVMAMNLYGVAMTPVWKDMRARGFLPNSNKGLQIQEYAFTDETVNRLFQKFSSYFHALYTVQKVVGRQAIYWGYKRIQGQIYEKIVEFSAAENIHARIMRFLDSPEESL